MSTPPRGTLFAIVGPSGAGKDTLIAAARAAFAADPRYLFARRVITRLAEARGEPHEPATPEEFAALAEAGGFVLSWQAHGLAYGIRRDVAETLAGGRHVIANLSRAVVAEARLRLPPAIVVEITAAPAVLAARLAARGREDAAAIARRLARVASSDSVPDRRVDNSTDLAVATAAFLAALRAG